jgi:hypothetical protein
VGSRNAATEVAQALLDGEDGALMRKCVELALDGDKGALRLCVERLVPRRGRSVRLELPAIETAADIAPAMAAIARAAAEGAITPYDGAELSRIVESCVRALELGDFERRLREVEASVAPGLKALDRRLRRVAALVEKLKPDLDRRRDLMAARQIVSKAIRAGLTKAGIDPDDVPVLRRFEAPEPPPLPDPIGQIGEPDPRQILCQRLKALAQRCREHPPTPAECSPAMLFAMCCFGDGIALAPAPA